MSNLNEKTESIISKAVQEASDANQTPDNISFLDVNGKSVNLTFDESCSYLRGDFRTAEMDYEKAQEVMKHAEGMVQGILYSLVETLYSDERNKKASDKEILRLFDFAVASIEETAGVSSKESDAGLYSKTYAARKSPIRSNIKKVGNPFDIKLEGDEQLTSYAWLKRGKKENVKNELEKNHANQSSKVSKINAKRKKLGQKPMSSKELKTIADMNRPADIYLDKEIVKLDTDIDKVDKANAVIKVAQGRAVK